MKKGNWWFKLEQNLWLGDEALSGCSLEAQGFWMRVVCLMHKAGSPEITGAIDQVARMVGCFPEELMRCALELKQKNAANVTLGNGTVTLLSRKLKRELTSKEKTRLRVLKHRGNGSVTLQSKSNKKEVRKEVCVNEAIGEKQTLHTETILDGLRAFLNLQVLSFESEWMDAADWAFVNRFSASQFLECHELLTKQKWRKGRVSPENVMGSLPNLPKLRDEIRDQENGNSNRASKQRPEPSNESLDDLRRKFNAPGVH